MTSKWTDLGLGEVWIGFMPVVLAVCSCTMADDSNQGTQEVFIALKGNIPSIPLCGKLDECLPYNLPPLFEPPSNL